MILLDLCEMYLRKWEVSGSVVLMETLILDLWMESLNDSGTKSYKLKALAESSPAVIS